MSRGASFGLGDAISAMGIEMVYEREQNARKEALTAVVGRVRRRWAWRAVCDRSP